MHIRLAMFIYLFCVSILVYREYLVGKSFMYETQLIYLSFNRASNV